MPGVTRHAAIAAFATALLNVAAIALLGIAAPQGAMAECIGPWTPMPAFTEVAPTAQRVVVGTVIQDLENPRGLDEWGGVTPSFVMEVDTVLRGPDPGATLAMDLVATGMPQTEECGGRPTVFAVVGDRIAVAFDGRLPGHRRPITTAAWIELLPEQLDGMEAEVLTMSEVRRALQPLPDTSTADGHGRDPAPHTAEALGPLLARLARSLLSLLLAQAP